MSTSSSMLQNDNLTDRPHHMPVPVQPDDVIRLRAQGIISDVEIAYFLGTTCYALDEATGASRRIETSNVSMGSRRQVLLG